MTKALFLFLIGAAAGAFGYYYLQEKRAAAATPVATTEAKPTEKSAQPAPTFGERAREEAKSVKTSVENKLNEWHLTPDEIGRELSRTGEVVRTKAHDTGETIATTATNARIVTLIKAKYALDTDLSARAIEVACEGGQVTLNGNVANTALVAKAVGIALDTDGVTHVTAKLRVAGEKG